MAHFAELKQETDPFDSSKTNWVVKRVIVVDNTHVPSDELGNKLLIIIILENNMQVTALLTMKPKIYLLLLNLLDHGHWMVMMYGKRLLLIQQLRNMGIRQDLII
jgi:hypothetical protein